MNDDEVLGKAYDGRLMRRLLTYLKRSDLETYRALIEQLGLRH